MAKRSERGSWIDGPVPAEGSWAGERFGLPQTGRGSVAATGRRIAGIIIDWLLCTLLASLIVGRPADAGDEAFIASSLAHSAVTIALFFLMHVLFVWQMGFTVGHRVLGMGVIDLETKTRPAAAGFRGFVRALVRAVLLLLVVPALMLDSDRRGLHDRAGNTAVLRF